jgi:hypothetical protein
MTIDRPDYLDIAERLAPVPASQAEATTRAWVRHYAAVALAAHAAFRDALPTISACPDLGSRPELGYLAQIANSSTAAAHALLVVTDDEEQTDLWDLTPEAGALNGEYLDWLAEVLDVVGINPADLYPWFNAADFRSPSQLAAVTAETAVA